jgi:DNA-binding response OmpR family regulator
METNKARILCVEDESDTHHMLRVFLSDFEIISALTKTEAIELARNNTFSLILMDYWLPDGTGEDACRVIRSFDSRTPILFITGSHTFSETKARAIGAQGTLKKASPTFMQELKTRAGELTLN